MVTAIECDIDELVQALGGPCIARCITDRLEHGDRGLAPNPRLPGDESERGVYSRNCCVVRGRRRGFRLSAVRPDSHRTNT